MVVLIINAIKVEANLNKLNLSVEKLKGREYK